MSNWIGENKHTTYAGALMTKLLITALMRSVLLPLAQQALLTRKRHSQAS
jgi:hypothetical protein